MNDITITFEDIGIDKYIQHSTDKKLGRMFDNDAVSIKIIRPVCEENSNCYLIATDNNGKVLDQIDMSSNETTVKRHLSENYSINIGFAFTRDDGYVKNSSVERYTFEKALDPNKHVDVEPEQAININQVVNKAFASAVLEAGSLDFYNVKNEKVGSVKIEVSNGITNKEFVDELPVENINTNTLYFLRKTDAEENNYYDEYIYKDSKWEKIGSAKVELSNYYTKKETNKQISNAISSAITTALGGDY